MEKKTLQRFIEENGYKYANETGCWYVLSHPYKGDNDDNSVLIFDSTDELLSSYNNQHSHLSAAAPDLLEACERMVKAFSDAPIEWLQTQDVMDAEIFMRTAINKATTIKL